MAREVKLGTHVTEEQMRIWLAAKNSPRYRLRYDDNGKEYYEPEPPCLNQLCEPLLGTPVVDPQTGLVVVVKYPDEQQSIYIYERAIQSLERFAARDDLWTLSYYRGHLYSTPWIPAIVDHELDERYLVCLRAAIPILSRDEWELIALRLPLKSRIRAQCLEHANFEAVAIAAE